MRRIQPRALRAAVAIAIASACGAPAATAGPARGPSATDRAASAARIGYVAEFGADALRPFDLRSLALHPRIPVGDGPRGAAFSRDGRLIFVTNSAGGTVSVVRAASRRVFTTIPVGVRPVTVAAVGAEMYVVNQGSATVSVIDTESLAVTHAISIGGAPEGLAANPDASAVFVADTSADRIVTADTAKRSVVAQATAGPMPVRVAADSEAVYTTDFGDSSVSVLPRGQAAGGGTIAVGGRPYAIAVRRGKAYVTNRSEATISVVDLKARRETARLAVGQDPFSVALHPFADIAIVAGAAAGTLTAIDTSVDAVRSTVSGLETPADIAVSRSPPMPAVTQPERGRIYPAEALLRGGVRLISSETEAVDVAVAYVSSPRGARRSVPESTGPGAPGEPGVPGTSPSARLEPQLCRFAGRDGRLSRRATPCDRLAWQEATAKKVSAGLPQAGDELWAFKLRGALPGGKYRVWARARQDANAVSPTRTAKFRLR